MVLARRALKLLTCLDSRDKIRDCLTVEEQFVLNSFMIFIREVVVLLSTSIAIFVFI